MSVFVEVGVQWVRGRQPVPGWKLIPTTAGVDTRVGAGGSGVDTVQRRASRIPPDGSRHPADDPVRWRCDDGLRIARVGSCKLPQPTTFFLPLIISRHVSGRVVRQQMPRA